MTKIKLIFGLGNPGKEYETNNHNVGRLFLDYLAKKYGAENEKDMKTFSYSNA